MNVEDDGDVQVNEVAPEGARKRPQSSQKWKQNVAKSKR